MKITLCSVWNIFAKSTRINFVRTVCRSVRMSFEKNILPCPTYSTYPWRLFLTQRGNPVAIPLAPLVPLAPLTEVLPVDTSTPTAPPFDESPPAPRIVLKAPARGKTQAPAAKKAASSQTQLFELIKRRGIKSEVPRCLKESEGKRPWWNAELEKCETCPLGEIFDTLALECHPTCPQQTPWWNTKNVACEICMLGTRWNPTTRLCEACPENVPWFDGGECKVCPTGRSWNPTLKVCGCPANKPVLRGTECEACNDDGHQGFEWDAKLSRCVCPLANPVFEEAEGKQYCRPCPPKTRWNTKTFKCMPMTEKEIFLAAQQVVSQSIAAGAKTRRASLELGEGAKTAGGKLEVKDEEWLEENWPEKKAPTFDRPGISGYPFLPLPFARLRLHAFRLRPCPHHLLTFPRLVPALNIQHRQKLVNRKHST